MIKPLCSSIRPIVFIMRGLPGSGKSTLVQHLKSLIDTTVCSADHFFERNGEYHFDGNKLGLAHAACKQKFAQWLEAAKPGMACAVDNTNLRPSDISTYVDLCKNYQVDVHILSIESQPDNRSVHRLPDSSLERLRKVAASADKEVATLTGFHYVPQSFINMIHNKE